MDLEQLKQQAQELQQLNPSVLSQEQLVELVEKLSGILENTEQQLSNIKIEENNE
jgi:adenosylmethionine-8-amino-7-oxononanoate aminotransferase